MPDHRSTEITDAEAQSVHIRAEAILTDALTAQERAPDSYSYSEYLIATEQAVAEHNMTASRISGIAEDAGTIGGERMWKLDGELVNDAKLLGTIERRHANVDLVREVDRELGEPLKGLDVHTTAMKMLASRGIHDPDRDQLLEAYIEVAE